MTNTGAVTAAGADSRAIVAQSVGGGGGDAGITISGAVSVTGQGAGISSAVALGGSGNVGGNGGLVIVQNSADLVTSSPANAADGTKLGGQGILAQSIGGGGPADLVAVNSTGPITTYGYSSAAISAQSAGGGGGNAGYVFNANFAAGSQTMAGVFGITQGGSRGSGRSGGEVDVTSDGALTTQGDNSPGIQAQSIGGGGGNAAYTVALSLAQPGSQLQSVGLTGAIGGSGGTGATSGPVTVTNKGSITTGLLAADGSLISGSGSHGIVAMSIGGGGSAALTVAMAVLVTATASVTAGGSGGTGGNSGLVTVSNDGAILVRANAAAGLVARSIGGGGDSQATSVMVGVGENLFSQKNGAVNVAVGNQGAGRGDGAAVTVTNTGAITTSQIPSSTPPPSDPPIDYRAPINSCGIFAQSVGGDGDGGSAGAYALGFNASAASSWQATLNVAVGGGGSGSGNTVTVSNTTTIKTVGDDAVGIFAQSIGGCGGTGGGASPLSLFPLSSLDISVGGKGGTAGNGGAVGTVTTTVTNTGTIVGEHLAGSGTTLDVNNQPAGTLVTGPRMILGAGGLPTNHGVIDVGGPGRLRTTALAGNLVQGASGAMVMSFSPYIAGRGPAASLLAVTGNATLAGAILMRPLDVGVARLGRHSVELVRATGALSSGGLAVAPSVVAQYQLVRPSARSVAVSYDIDFANPTVSAGLRSAQLAVASHLKALHGAGQFPAGFGYLLGFGTVEGYGGALDRLSPEPYATNLWTAALAAARFSDAMLDCRARADRQQAVDDDSCLAMGFTGWTYVREDSSDALGYDLGALSFAISAEKRLSPGWAIGGGLGYDNLFARGDGRIWNSNSNLFQAGAFVRHDSGAFALTTAVYGGGGSPAVRRYTTEDTATHGDQALLYGGTTLRAEYPVEAAGGTIRLQFDLNAVHVTSDSLREDGALGRLAVGSGSETLVSVRPMIEWSIELPRGDYLVRPRIGLGLTQYLSDPSPAITASFLDAGSSQPPMRVPSRAQRTYGDAVLRLDIARVGGMVFGGGVLAQLADASYVLGGSFHLHVPF